MCCALNQFIVVGQEIAKGSLEMAWTLRQRDVSCCVDVELATQQVVVLHAPMCFLTPLFRRNFPWRCPPAKDITYPDRNFVEPCSLGLVLFIFVMLSLPYFSIPLALVYHAKSVPDWYQAIVVAVFTTGEHFS